MPNMASPMMDTENCNSDDLPFQYCSFSMDLLMKKLIQIEQGKLCIKWQTIFQKLLVIGKPTTIKILL